MTNMSIVADTDGPAGVVVNEFDTLGIMVWNVVYADAHMDDSIIWAAQDVQLCGSMTI